MKKSHLSENIAAGDASFLRTLMDNPFEGILAIDNAGVVTFVNSFFLSILKVSQGEILGKKYGTRCRVAASTIQFSRATRNGVRT